MNKEDRDYYGVISFFYALLPHLAVERMIGYVSRQKDSYDSIPVAERKSLSPREYDKHSRPILIPATANRNRSLFDVLSF